MAALVNDLKDIMRQCNGNSAAAGSAFDRWWKDHKKALKSMSAGGHNSFSPHDWAEILGKPTLDHDLVRESCLKTVANWATKQKKIFFTFSDLIAIASLETSNNLVRRNYIKICAPVTDGSSSGLHDLLNCFKDDRFGQQEIEEYKWGTFGDDNDDDSDDNEEGRQHGGGASNNQMTQQQMDLIAAQQLLIAQQQALLLSSQQNALHAQQQQQKQHHQPHVQVSAPVGPPQNAKEVAIEGYGDIDNMAVGAERSFAPILAQAPPEVLQFNISSDVKPKTKDQAKEILMKKIDDELCWGKGPANEMEIKSCVGLASFTCKVETFVEYRTSARVHKPYHKGTPYTSPRDGPAPQPWQMICGSQPFFKDAVEKIEIPNTSSISTCFECSGTGRVRCSPCHGDGKQRCSNCGGDGRIRVNVTRDGKSHTEHKNCHTCGGDGKVRCKTCGGDGKVTCNVCDGTGQIRYFLLMTRTHKTLVNEKVVKENIPDSDLSDKSISAAKGTTVLEKQGVNLAPPKGFNDLVDAALVEIDKAAAQQLITLNGYQHQERILMKSVPVTLAKAKSKDGEEFRWYIYGTDNRIEVCNYPATMCCGCEIA